jgi:hypothetical protein
MPVLDGPGLLRRVLEEPTLVAGHAYVYMTAGSGYLSPDVQMLLATLQIPVLLKPFNIDDVLDALAAAAHRLRTRSRPRRHGSRHGRYGDAPGYLARRDRTERNNGQSAMW